MANNDAETMISRIILGVDYGTTYTGADLTTTFSIHETILMYTRFGICDTNPKFGNNS
jgi:hypothetical protein